MRSAFLIRLHGEGHLWHRDAQKPVAESSALFVPTAIYPFPDGADKAFQAISGNARSPLCDLGWKSVGVPELTALPSIDKEVWTAAVQESDALLVWGGDPVYLSYWMNAIDDETAVKVVNGTVEVVSEGHWKLFSP